MSRPTLRVGPALAERTGTVVTGRRHALPMDENRHLPTTGTTAWTATDTPSHAAPHPAEGRPVASDPSFTIDCAQCSMQQTDACGDCVVTYICSREPGDALVIDLGEYRALEMLAESGLVPTLRHRPRSATGRF